MPLFAVAFMIVTLSSVALPGTNGFIGEFLILLGSWGTNPGLTALATTGVIFGAVYMLWMFQRVMFGEVTHEENKNLKDLSGRELAVLAPMIVAIFAMGVFPNFFFSKLTPSIDRLVARAGVAQAQTATASLGLVSMNGGGN
jgi:NADH-quinone oxidoreductase subunit M